MHASRNYIRIESRSNHPRFLHYLAETVQGSIYLLLCLMPLTGAAAWFYTWASAADAHELLQVGLLAAIGLHIYFDGEASVDFHPEGLVYALSGHLAGDDRERPSSGA